MKFVCAVLVFSAILASPAISQENKRTTAVPLAGGQVIVAGKWLKAAAGTIDIPFGVTFSEAPIVVVSSNYTSPVGAVETITNVATDKFQVSSANAAPNYYVSWIAIGTK